MLDHLARIPHVAVWSQRPPHPTKFKEIKRFEASETKDPKSKPEKKETIVNIPNGKGQSLETMSEVVKNFASESDKDLKVTK